MRRIWLVSFDPLWLEWLNQLDTERLAKAGFYYEGFYHMSGGKTVCFSCGLWKYSSFWQEGHDPETVHQEESPNCLFVTGQSDNVSIRRRTKKTAVNSCCLNLKHQVKKLL